jgi:hypothetical protein
VLTCLVPATAHTRVTATAHTRVTATIIPAKIATIKYYKGFFRTSNDLVVNLLLYYTTNAMHDVISVINHVSTAFEKAVLRIRSRREPHHFGRSPNLMFNEDSFQKMTQTE